MKIRKCDICDKPCNWSYYRIKNIHNFLYKQTFKLDVCAECWNDMSKWIKEQRKGEE